MAPLYKTGGDTGGTVSVSELFSLRQNVDSGDGGSDRIARPRREPLGRSALHRTEVKQMILYNLLHVFLETSYQ